MRFVFFDDFCPGVLRDDRVIDIGPLLYQGTVHTPQEALEALITGFDRVKPEIEGLLGKADGVPLSSVRLRAPVPRPLQLLCAIMNYTGDGREPHEEVFMKSPLSVIGQGDTVCLPPVKARVFHHEAELALVIGRGGHALPTSEAMDHVFGYTGFIDVSARDTGTGFHMRKSYDTFGPMGPVLVTADEIPDPQNLHVQLSVNGKVRQDFSTSLMAVQIPRLIEIASSVSSLVPGDVIATGTHHLGMGPIQDGDRVALNIEHVGRLEVQIEDPQKRHWDVS